MVYTDQVDEELQNRLHDQQMEQSSLGTRNPRFQAVPVPVFGLRQGSIDTNQGSFWVKLLRSSLGVYGEWTESGLTQSKIV